MFGSSIIFRCSQREKKETAVQDTQEYVTEFFIESCLQNFHAREVISTEIIRLFLHRETSRELTERERDKGVSIY